MGYILVATLQTIVLVQVLKRHLTRREGVSPGTVVLIAGNHPSTKMMVGMVRKAGCPVKVLASKSLAALKHGPEADFPLLDWHVWLQLQVLLQAKPELQNPEALLDSGNP